jgi:nucleoid-associated protein YgaU
MGQAARDYNLIYRATRSVESDERVHFTNMDNDANAGVIGGDPNRIYPGQVLVIP